MIQDAPKKASAIFRDLIITVFKKYNVTPSDGIPALPM